MPTLVSTATIDPHIASFEVTGNRFLITSPEYQMKRQLAAGSGDIFYLGKCFRKEEAGAQHNPEFTMLEWYRLWPDLNDLLAETQKIVELASSRILGIDTSAPWKIISVAEVLEECAGVAVTSDMDALALKRAFTHLDLHGSQRWDDIFYSVFVDHVEPWLSRQDKIVAIVDWPLQLAALARVNSANPTVAERFEVYIKGIELANAFGELTDPQEQRRRFDSDNAARQELGKPTHALDEKFLGALADMPTCVGCALGVDRLVMLATGAQDIQDVLPFGWDEC